MGVGPSLPSPVRREVQKSGLRPGHPQGALMVAWQKSGKMIGANFAAVAKANFASRLK